MDRGKGNNLLWFIGRNASEYDSEGQIMMIMMTTIMMTKKSRGEGGGERVKEREEEKKGEIPVDFFTKP